MAFFLRLKKGYHKKRYVSTLTAVSGSNGAAQPLFLTPAAFFSDRVHPSERTHIIRIGVFFSIMPQTYPFSLKRTGQAGKGSNFRGNLLRPYMKVKNTVCVALSINTGRSQSAMEPDRFPPRPAVAARLQSTQPNIEETNKKPLTRRCDDHDRPLNTEAQPQGFFG